MNKYVMELIGTFFLVLTIGLTAFSPSMGPFSPIAIGGILIAMIYAGGPISGAHYNPAVTLAVFLSKKSTLAESLYYVLFQLIGATIAAYCVILLKGSTGTIAEIEHLPTIVAETIFTFALVFVILNVGFSEQTKGNAYFGIAIGLTVIGAIYAVGNISGAILNPAVWIGLLILNLSSPSTVSIYIGSHILAGILAWKAFQIVNSK